MYRKLQSLNFICIPYYARLSQCLLQKVRCGATSIKTPSTFITLSRIKNIIWYIKYRSFCIDTNIVSIIQTIIKILITNLWFYVLFLYFFYVKKNGQKYLGLQHSIRASDSNFLLAQNFFSGPAYDWPSFQALYNDKREPAPWIKPGSSAWKTSLFKIINAMIT